MAGQPFLSTKDLIISEGGFLRYIRGMTNTALDITGGTLAKIDFLSVVAMTPSYASGAPSTDKYFDTKLSTAWTLRVANTTSGIMAKTGYKTSMDSKTIEKFDATLLVGSTAYLALLDDYRNGKVIMAIRGMGRIVGTDAVAGYEHICGVITELTATPKDGLFEMKIVITAQQCTINASAVASVNYTAYDALATGGTNTIEPVGDIPLGPFTIKAIGDAPSFTNLVTLGKIVQTTAS